MPGVRDRGDSARSPSARCTSSGDGEPRGGIEKLGATDAHKGHRGSGRGGEADLEIPGSERESRLICEPLFESLGRPAAGRQCGYHCELISPNAQVHTSTHFELLVDCT